MPEVFSHVSKETTVWASPQCLEGVLKLLRVGKEVKVCGRDGWPEHWHSNIVLVRLINTPPPMPVSTFDKGEIVVSPNQIKVFWFGGEEGC